MNPAEKLRKALAGNQGHRPQPVTDDFAKAIARELESRGIAKVPGLPEDDEPEPAWFDMAIEHDRRNEELAAEREARRKAEEEAENAPKTTAEVLRNAIRGSSAPLALNGAGILRAALAGGHGTINGRNE